MKRKVYRASFLTLLISAYPLFFAGIILMEFVTERSIDARTLISMTYFLIVYGFPINLILAALFNWFFYYRICEEGITGYDTMGKRVSLGWDEITEIKPARIIWLKYVRVYSPGKKYPLLLPLFMDGLGAFRKDLLEAAPEDNPLAEYFSGLEISEPDEENAQASPVDKKKLSISEQIGTIIALPFSPYKTAMRLSEQATTTAVITPILILWLTNCTLSWKSWSMGGFNWWTVLSSTLSITLINLFFSAVAVHLIAIIFRTSAGFKENFICLTYAFFFPTMFESIMDATDTGALFFFPVTILLLVVVPLAIGGANKTGFFRGLAFYLFTLMLEPFLASVIWHLRLSHELVRHFQSVFWLGIFSDHVKFALILLSLVSSAIVGSVKNRFARSVAISISVIFLFTYFGHKTMLFYVEEFAKDPINTVSDYYVSEDTIYFASFNADRIRVAEYDLATGTRESIKKFDIHGEAYLTADTTGNLFVVTIEDHNISVYEYGGDGRPIFSIDEETHGCDYHVRLFGNNFLFDSNGDFIMGCGSGEIQRYSRDGKMKSGILMKSDDKEIAAKQEGDRHKPLVMLAVALDREDKIFAVMRDSLKKVSMEGEILDTYKFEEGVPIHDISISGRGTLYVLLRKRDKETDQITFSISGLDENGKILGDTILYEGKSDDRPTYTGLRTNTKDTLVLKAADRSMNYFNEFIVMNPDGNILYRLPENTFRRKVVSGIYDFNQKFSDMILGERDVFDAILDTMEEADPDFDGDKFRDKE